MLAKCIGEPDARAATEALTRAGSLSISIKGSKFAPGICFLEALRLQRREGRHGHSRRDAHGMFMGRNNKDATDAAQRQRLNVMSPVLELLNAPTAFEKHWSSMSATQVNALCHDTTKQIHEHYHAQYRHRLSTNTHIVFSHLFGWQSAAFEVDCKRARYARTELQSCSPRC